MEQELTESLALECLLFPEKTPIEDRHSENYYQDYLAEVTSFTLTKLKNEPQRLEQERLTNQREIGNLAFNNYQTFIKGAECTKSVHNQVREVSKSVSDLQWDLPALSQSCHKFCDEAQEIAKKRKKNDITLQQHTAMLELLELPQLMDTCVKNKFYEEALKLENFAKKLQQENPQSTIIKSIIKDVEISTEVMISQLHQQLSSQCRLSDSISIINYLKLLGIYNERELRVTFLQCRDQFMNYIISLIPTGISFMNISKMIDTYRSELIDIINQYNTIFGYTSDYVDEFSGILYSWTHHKIREFLLRLNNSLDNIKDGSFLTNVINSCMFFAKNLGRVGIDFRGLLPPIFESCILNIFDRNLSRAVSQFGSHLRKYKNLAAHKGLSAYNMTTDPSDPLPAPRILLDFPPLAILTNAILETFNELRTCWPYSLKTVLAQHLTQDLSRVLQKLREHKNQTTMTPQEQILFSEMCQVVAEELLPYVATCFDKVFQSTLKLINVDSLQNSIVDMYEMKMSQQVLTKFLMMKTKEQNGKNLSVGEQTKIELK